MSLPLKVLIIVTSHAQMGQTGKPTGYYLPEVSHPYFALESRGIEVDIASPQGGQAPMDASSRDLTDPANRQMLETPAHAHKLEQTLKLADVDFTQYKGIFFAGGHGTMWDFPRDAAIKRAAEGIYNRGGYVASVCHGPAALLSLQLPDGTPLVRGKRIAAFTNAEEEAAQLTQVMPFLLETELAKLGAVQEKADLWQKKVVTDGRLITGQNPASAEGVGEALADALNAQR